MLSTIPAALAARTTRVAWVLGLLLTLPTLGLGFAVDDYFHAAMLSDMRHFGDKADWDLFNFLGGKTDDMGPVQGTMLPWWGNPEARFRFFRPLSALTHVVDYAVAGKNAVAQHAHTLLWWIALLAAALRWFRAAAGIFGPWPHAALQTALCALVFAVDDAHAWPVAWIANRNALVGSVFVALFCTDWLRYRSTGEGAAKLRALVMLTLAMAGGEVSFTALAFVLAYELVAALGPWSTRLRAALPVLASFGLYLVLYKWAGFGAHGSTLYIDPGDEPLRFLWAAVSERFPLLIAGTFTPVPAELGFILLEAPKALTWGVGWGLGGAVILMLWRTLREDRATLLLFVAGCFALIPMCGTFAANRLLVAPSLFFVPVIVRVGLRWFDAGRRALAWTWGAVHVPLAAGIGLAQMGLVAQMADVSERRMLAADYPADPQARVVILNAADFLTATYLPMGRWFLRGDLPAACWLVSLVPGDVELRRLGPKSIHLWAPSPGFGATMWEGLFRDRFDLPEGFVQTRGEMVATVTDVDRGLVRGVRLDFARDLDDPSMWVLAWDGTRLARRAAPKVGDCEVLPLRLQMIEGMEVDLRPRLGDRCLDRGAGLLAGLAAPSAAGRGVAALVGAAEGGAAAQSLTAQPGPSVGGLEKGSPVDASVAPTGTCSVELPQGKTWAKSASSSCPPTGPLPFVVLGDPGKPGGRLIAVSEAARARCDTLGCAAMLLPGDIYYGSGESGPEGWAQIWDQGLKRVGRPTLAVFGNHEWREEPYSARKRQAVLRTHGRDAFIMPAASWWARIVRDGSAQLAVVGLDSDRIAAPTLGDSTGDPEAPEAPLRSNTPLGAEHLNAACQSGLPVVVMLHEPISTQAGHLYDRVDHIDSAPLVVPLLRQFIQEKATEGCPIEVVVAGHDHDLQFYGPGCEQVGTPATIVSGVAGKAFRDHHSGHLDPCPATASAESYHLYAQPEDTGGYTELRIDPERRQHRVVHHLVSAQAGDRTVHESTWRGGDDPGGKTP